MQRLMSPYGEQVSLPPRPAPFIYVIGRLADPLVPEVAAVLRGAGFEVFDDWYGIGPKADEHWQAYEQARGRSYAAALKAPHAQVAFGMDRDFLVRAEGAVAVGPLGKSAMAEVGFLAGRGTPTWILLPGDPERWDIMTAFASEGVWYDQGAMIDAMRARFGLEANNG